MESIPLERLLILAVFVLAPLLSLLRRWLAARRPAPEPGEPPAPVPPRSRAPAPVREPPVHRAPGAPRVPPAGRPGRTAARPVAPQTLDQALVGAARRRRPRFRLGGPAEVRRAVVAMTVLGPCRALERPGDAGPGDAPERR